MDLCKHSGAVQWDPGESAICENEQYHLPQCQQPSNNPHLLHGIETLFSVCTGFDHLCALLLSLLREEEATKHAVITLLPSSVVRVSCSPELTSMWRRAGSQ